MVQIPFTKRELIISLSIGDGHLHMQQKAMNAYLDITHSAKQQEYLLWKHNLLNRSGFSSHVSKKYNMCKQKKILTFRLLTKSNEIISDVYKGLYLNGKKNMKFILQNLSPFVLAVWYMDDGSKKVKKKIKRKDGTIISFKHGYIDAYMIAVNGFSFDECEDLCAFLRKKYDVVGHVQKDRGKPRISISDNRSKNNFRNLISPYIDVSMLYKINGIATFGEAMLLDQNIEETEGTKEN